MSKVAVFAFQPKEGGTTVVTNAASATVTVALPATCDTIALTNSSATATVFVRVTQYVNQSDFAAAVTNNTGEAPSITADMPIMPSSQIRRAVGEGLKVIRTIASAADGSIYITPGTGV